MWDDLAEWWDALPGVRKGPHLHSRVLRCITDASLQPETSLVLRILLRDGQPVAGLPLYLDAGRRLRSLAGRLLPPTDLVMADDDEVKAIVPEWLDSIPVAHLYKVDEESIIAQALETRKRWILRRVDASPYIDLRDGVEGFRSVMSSKSLSTLRRKRRRLEELGEVRFVDHADSTAWKSTLDAGLELEDGGWKGAQGKSVLKRPKAERFFRSLAEVAEEEGWLRLSALYLEDRMLAFHYDLVYGDRRHLEITAYDESPEFRKFSPGSLLLENVLEQSCKDGLTEFDCGYGDAVWKDRWAPNHRYLYDISIYGSTPRGRIARRLQRGKGKDLATERAQARKL